MISGEFEVCKIQFSTLVDKKVAKVVKLSVFKEQLSKFKAFEFDTQHIDDGVKGIVFQKKLRKTGVNF